MGSPGLHGWSQGTLTGSSTPCPTGPTCHAGDSPWLSQAGALAFLAWEAEGCWCTARPRLAMGRDMGPRVRGGHELLGLSSESSWLMRAEKHCAVGLPC